MQLKDSHLFLQSAFIDGQAVAADDGATFAVDDPATGRRLGTVPDIGTAQGQRAIDAAQRALAAWRAKSALQRAGILRAWYELMIAHQEDLAVIMTAEQGKPLAESRAEISYAASFLQWFAEEGRRVYGDLIPANTSDRRLLVMKQPVGVCAAITPWNFPTAMLTRKAAPALAAGCTMVVKPAELTPYSALALAVLAQRAGVPAGVFNVITTSQAPAIGKLLCESPVIRKLSFTGSTEVGRILLRQCADTVKKTSMELGGNAPFIVFDDADLDRAVQGAIASKYRNSGQTCVCANRLLVQDGIYDDFARRLVTAVSALKVGNGFDADSNIGPLIESAAVEKVERHVADAVSKGARLLIGGHRHALQGRFYEPTVLADAQDNMLLAEEETFGPVAPLFRFKTDEEAIARANATQFGLASYFYSRDIHRVFKVAEALECGMVGVNEGIISTEVAPFGGVKQSGLGREGSKYGIEDYLEIKYVCLGGMA
jgi:succinate-semialdehyde dehydrogenase/glutarate-semialdehyde dehydrogenase